VPNNKMVVQLWLCHRC